MCSLVDHIANSDEIRTTYVRKMNDDELVNDPFDKVSGQLRKAVGQNRHEIGGLSSIVSQMKRDRNKSVGRLSKQQQEFLQKQTRLLPAISLKRKSRKTANQVIPLSHEAICSPPKESHSPSKICLKNSTQFNVLPPIPSDRNTTKDLSFTENEAKLRRISDYRKELSSLQECLNNAHRFASSSSIENASRLIDQKAHHLTEGAILKPNYQRFLQNRSEKEEKADREHPKNFSTKFVHERKDCSITHINEQKLTDVRSIETGRWARQSPVSVMAPIDHVTHANKPVVKAKLLGSISEGDGGRQRNYWDIVRQNINVIAEMNKKNRSKYLDELFQAIRQCRYIRKPKKRNPSTGVWYESEEESGIEEVFES